MRIDFATSITFGEKLINEEISAMILCSKVRRYPSDKLIIYQKCVRTRLFEDQHLFNVVDEI